jgi:hypothetical protein
MFIRTIFCAAVVFLNATIVNAQGCSDAGFCTAGNFNAIHYDSGVLQKKLKREIEVAFNYGTHLRDELFYQAQFSYRLIKPNGNYFELRLPLNAAFNKASDISNSGIGDIMLTYNDDVFKKLPGKFSYAAGLRISFTDASKKANNNNFSLPMSLQNGLGTTDIITVLNYDIIKYCSLATGIQWPVLQYNKHKTHFIEPGNTTVIIGENYRRQPDALLKATGHYQTGKFKFNAGILGIFHLANDHYNTTGGKYILKDSKGTTLNLTLDASYIAGKKLIISVLYAEPFKTRTNIPDGLARSSVMGVKFSRTL